MLLIIERTCSKCSKKIDLQKNQSGLVFNNEHFVCEDCCSAHSVDEINNWTGVRFMLLDVDNNTLRTRLEKRYEDEKNVLSLKRVTGSTPEEFIKSNMRYSKKLRQLCKEYRCNKLDTSDLTPEEVARKVAEFIQE